MMVRVGLQAAREARGLQRDVLVACEGACSVRTASFHRRNVDRD
jgi:hypothetical protein